MSWIHINCLYITNRGRYLFENVHSFHAQPNLSFIGPANQTYLLPCMANDHNSLPILFGALYLKRDYFMLTIQIQFCNNFYTMLQLDPIKSTHIAKMWSNVADKYFLCWNKNIRWSRAFKNWISHIFQQINQYEYNSRINKNH